MSRRYCSSGCYRIFALLVLLLALGVHGEPASLNTLLLREKLANGPERGGSEDTEKRGYVDVGDEQGSDATAEANEQEEYPGTGAPVVLCLDDDGMPNANREKGHDGNGNASKIHVRFLLFPGLSHNLCELGLSISLFANSYIYNRGGLTSATHAAALDGVLIVGAVGRLALAYG